MIDIGWSELLVIGVVALIVVGPKDLPIMFRRMGEFTGKARAMAREFSRAMDKAADEAGVKDVQADLRKIADPKQMGLDAIKDATGDLSDMSDLNETKGSAASKPTSTAERGPATQKLAEEREEVARAIRDSADNTPTETSPSETATSESPDMTDKKPA